MTWVLKIEEVCDRNAQDVERKLDSFAQYYHQHRVHQSLDAKTPISANNGIYSQPADLLHYSWQSNCYGLFQTPMAG